MAEPHGDGTRTRLDNLRLRLRRCAALVTAGHRRREVVEVVGDAVSDQEAAEAVSELLDVDAESASEIVDMPVKGFTKDRVSRLEDEAGRLQEKVATLSAEESESDSER